MGIENSSIVSLIFNRECSSRAWKQLQGYHGIGFLKHNSFLEYIELKEMAIVHFPKITKDENYLSYLAFMNSVFRLL